ncbi:tRNA (guanine(37)-N1)-methyltransferase [Wyeomyia smithii]|uniref:tRNA (guanine(37)-N1)-methyltransferase n=1 Tax=Wyeomyia smithii TaxID=174621 RepID=UPI002467AF53|nr:tRNA (guanine(37)-N1)-methyltransferase [Wyeomyia smithii]
MLFFKFWRYRISLKSNLQLYTYRLRHFFRNMECTDLHPPTVVRGMTILERNSFKKCAKVPHLTVPENEDFNKVCKSVKKFLLKMEQFKPVKSAERKIVLHPLIMESWDDFEKNALFGNLFKNNLTWENIQLEYDNWKYDEVLRAVLPEDKDILSSFSKVGHVVHLNLKDHLLEYKNLIGEVIKDKVPGCRTVVNKLVTIDNTYRNFEMEVIAGEKDFEVTVKENGNTFEFDFSKVYWNPRLSTEHEKIVKMLNQSDVLADVYAGVGPFSVPAAKKGCTVLANDLNPDSYKALVKNCIKNKVQAHATCFNKDAINFIREELRQLILEKNKDTQFSGKIHITMNLPALAIEHLVHYVGLFQAETLKLVSHPIVHCYCFAKGTEDSKTIARHMVESSLGFKLGDNLLEIAFVRNVSPNKDMMRVSFCLTEEVLFCASSGVKRSLEGNKDNPEQTLKRNSNRKKTMGKKNIKNRNQQKQIAKKAKNVFAVSQAKKNNVKKAKEVSGKLKKINVYEKREKADKNFQNLHAQIVTTKKTKKIPSKTVVKKDKVQANTKQVEAELNKMQM